MTKQEINIAIAEECGWKNISIIEEDVMYGTAPGWDKITLSKLLKQDVENDYTNHLVPDYCNDLNAMHEAEKVLTDDKIGVYEAHIYRICGVEPDSIFASDMRKVICATASQRAEAFLRTIGKWNEN